MENKKIFMITALSLIIGVLIISGTIFNFKYDKENNNIEQYKKDLKQITCYCGCEHTSLYNCYEEGMLTNCGVCMKEYETYLELKDTKTVEEISKLIDEKYGGLNEE